MVPGRTLLYELTLAAAPRKDRGASIGGAGRLLTLRRVGSAVVTEHAARMVRRGPDSNAMHAHAGAHRPGRRGSDLDSSPVPGSQRAHRVPLASDAPLKGRRGRPATPTFGGVPPRPDRRSQCRRQRMPARTPLAGKHAGGVLSGVRRPGHRHRPDGASKNSGLILRGR